MNTPEEIFSFKLGSALTMEQKLVEVLEELEEHANRDEIKRALREHREETRQHVTNIEQCFELLGEEVDDSLVDAVIRAAANESEHYEIAVYETLITNAEARGASGVAALLRRNLEEEKHALETAGRCATCAATPVPAATGPTPLSRPSDLNSNQGGATCLTTKQMNQTAT